jgi:hypothetical protein
LSLFLLLVIIVIPSIARVACRSCSGDGVSVRGT